MPWDRCQQPMRVAGLRARLHQVGSSPSATVRSKAKGAGQNGRDLRRAGQIVACLRANGPTCQARFMSAGPSSLPAILLCRRARIEGGS